MIAATVAMVSGALLFVLFGVFALVDGPGRGCSGDCGGCGGDTCELDSDLGRPS